MVARLRDWTARHERLIWAGLLAVVLTAQWPALKGIYYRAVDIPPPPSSIAWQTDLGPALLEAQRTNKLVLVDFSADWCPPCLVMKHDVWPDPAVERALTQSYVPVLIDVDTDQATAGRFGVDSIPTILVLDAAGTVVRRGGYLSASGLLNLLNEP